VKEVLTCNGNINIAEMKYEWIQLHKHKKKQQNNVKNGLYS